MGNARSKTPGKLHPIEVFRALKPHVETHPDTMLICDGGEFAQWGQSVLPVVPRRMINGVGGSIGSSLPMACAARVVEPEAPVFVVLGDGTFGFHMAEFETAVRCNLPFVAVVGTDARWNAEYNLQVRDYGPNRTFGCELLPTRYDLVVAALGGHGELVQSAGRTAGGDRAVVGERQAGLHQRHDREHSRAAGARRRLIHHSHADATTSNAKAVADAMRRGRSAAPSRTPPIRSAVTRRYVA